MLGVAYGPGIGDTRFSPVEVYVDLLMNAGAEVSFFDPYIKFWPEVSANVHQTLESLYQESPEVLVVTTGHGFVVEGDRLYRVLNSLEQPPILIDTVGLIDAVKLPINYMLGKNFFVLGVGS